jgi:hypothetical protein
MSTPAPQVRPIIKLTKIPFLHVAYHLASENIRPFRDIVRTKSFTRAAEWNNRAQAHARNLFLAREHEFGARLWERHHGFFQLARRPLPNSKAIMTGLRNL